LIYSTGTASDEAGDTDTEPPVDPRWDILKNLSKN
jgi:hypothetical protein